MKYDEFRGNKHEKELEEAYDELFRLAGRWRGTQPSDGADAPIHEEIVQEYHRVFQKMVELGWDWQSIDVYAQLPTALMPEMVYQLLGVDQLMTELLTQVRWWHMKISRPTLAIHTFDMAYSRLLELGVDPESILPRQSKKESSVIWYGIPVSPEGFYARNPEWLEKKKMR